VTYLACWLVAPLLLGALTLGAGLLVERLGGWRIPGPLLFGLGFCALVCVTQTTTLSDATAELSAPAALLVAAAGLYLGRARLREADRPGVLLALGVFGLYAAPAALTFEPTLLGYGSQGDAANHFLIVDRLMSHGTDLSGLGPSSFRDTVSGYFDSAYPTGSHTVLGLAHVLTTVDVAWLLQPYLAFLAAITALGLRALVEPHARRAWTASFAGGLAASAGLVYSYATNQQAVKELAALVCLVTAVALARPLLAAAPTWRAALPAALVVGGGLGVLSLALAPWIAPLALLVLVVLAVRHARRRPAALAAEIGVFVGVAGALALPAWTRANDFVTVTNTTLTGAQEFGNLLRELSFVQALGVWPAPDFRFGIPEGSDFAWLLVGIAAAGALLGLVVAVRRGAWPVLLFAAISLIGFAAVAGRASPWAYAKALMLLSPVALLLGGLAVAVWWDERRRLEAAALAVALAAGVLWTDALSYHASGAAPYERLDELAEIGDRFAGDGPLFYLDFDETAKHFLRDTQPVGAAEAYRPAWAALTSGETFAFGYTADLDIYVPYSVSFYFPLVVHRPAPDVSRPSSDYERAYHGRFYDVWRRVGGPEDNRVIEHLPLGNPDDAGDVPSCGRVRALARRAERQGARLAYAPRGEPYLARFGDAPAPGGWTKLPGDPQVWKVLGPGRVTAEVAVPAAGTYQVWLEGSIGREAAVTVDGREAGSLDYHVNLRPQQMRVGAVRLDAGVHEVAVEVGGGDLRPGNGSRDRLVGPVTLTQEEDPGAAPVRTVAPGAFREVCAARADWVEVVR
jgi:hypothetical protein